MTKCSLINITISVVVAAFGSCIIPTVGIAGTPEDDYLAARKADYAAIRAAETAGKSEDELTKLDDAALKDLKAKLVAVLGPHPIPSMPVEAYYMPETLLRGNIESGGVDGLSVAVNEFSPHYIVSTEKIILAWASDEDNRERFGVGAKPSIKSLITSEALYTSSVGVDSSFAPYLDLPIKAAPGVIARVNIGRFAQDISLSPPDTLVMGVFANDRVVIAEKPAKTAITDPKVCSKYKSKENGYIGCVAKEIRKSPQFAALTQEAQQLLDSAIAKP